MAEWFYNSDSGAIDSQEGVIDWFNRNLGINDFQTKYLNWHGPFSTKQEAFQYYVDNKAAHPDWKEPTDSAWQAFKNTTGDVAGATADILGIPGGQINAGNWLIRVGEIVLGIVLIGVGVAKLTGATNVVSKLAKV